MHCDHEYRNFRGGKSSKSRGAAVDVPHYLSKYDPDLLRYYLTAPAPETRDTEACPEGLEGFSWEDFVERKNQYLGYEGQLFGTQHVVEYEEEARHNRVRSHQALTYDESGAVGTWALSALPAGQALRAPMSLFNKLDDSVIEGEYAPLGG